MISVHTDESKSYRMRNELREEDLRNLCRENLRGLNGGIMAFGDEDEWVREGVK